MNFIYFWGVALGLRCCAGFSLVTESGGCCLFAAPRLLIVVTSLVVEHRHEAPALQYLQHAGSVVVACGL